MSADPQAVPPRPVLAVLPVKSLDLAKTRLAPALSAIDRRRLMLAMVTDVLTALRRSEHVARVVVVTDDRDVRHRSEAEGALVVSDESASSHSAAALRGIAASATPLDRVFLAPGDCPLLTEQDLATLLGRPQPPVVIVPDRHGDGTNALLLDPPDAIEPSFGVGSCARHEALAREAGLSSAVLAITSLTLDIDTPDDLHTLRARLEFQRGGAAATRGVLASLVDA